MKTIRNSMASLLLIGLCSCSPASPQNTPRPQADKTTSPLMQEAQLHFKALSRTKIEHPKRFALGQMLFHETRLSKDKQISCNTCHDLKSYGTTGDTLSLGHQNQLSKRNTPTVLNSHLNATQFWDGRSSSLEQQAGQPILDPREMAMPSEAAAIKALQEIPGYQKAFQQSFPNQTDPLNFDNLQKAIAYFEETLVTPSRFDQFLEGNETALSQIEKSGLRIFIDRGCIACHSGIGLGGESHQLFGITAPYKHQNDLGRYNISQDKIDRYVFKVPLLRNIAKTAPYFHDGKVQTLKEAIQIMGETQLGRTLTENEITALESFLNSLTGELTPEQKETPERP